MLTKAHLLKFLLQMISICGINDVKTNGSLLKHGFLNFQISQGNVAT